MKVRILGCGPSSGVPVLNCICKICTNKTKKKNTRTRTSAFFSTKNTNIVIDTGQDFRQQMLQFKFNKIDGVLYSHSHSDHCLGIDDLRMCAFSQEKPINIYGNKETIDYLKNKFKFLFHAPTHVNIPWLHLDANVIEYDLNYNIGDFHITAIKQQHGYNTTMGFILNNNNINIAYSTDISDFEPKYLDILKKKKLDLWIISYIGYEGNIAHATPQQIKQWVDYIKPKQTILTHMSHVVDYYKLFKELNNTNITPAFDGMEVFL